MSAGRMISANLIQTGVVADESRQLALFDGQHTIAVDYSACPCIYPGCLLSLLPIRATHEYDTYLSHLKRAQALSTSTKLHEHNSFRKANAWRYEGEFADGFLCLWKIKLSV